MKFKDKTLSPENYRKIYLGNGRKPILPSDVHRRAARFFITLRCHQVLDIGCGYGQLVDLLINNGIDAYGCDYIDYKEFLREHPKLLSLWLQGKCFVADCRNLPFKEGTFDGIALIGVLSLLSRKDMDKCFKECQRVLVKGG